MSFFLMETTKTFGCRMYGYIRVSKMALKIIDTPEFQRMRNISQLGLCSRVFPAANHTRFEHSLGVYHLASKMIKRLQKKYPDREYNVPCLGKVKLDNFIAELIKIAGLCHDIGHGPFSHIFDDILERSHSTNPLIYHENRSCILVQIICQRELADMIKEPHIKFIQSLIKPGEKDTGALYQIISNNLNGIDVDKFDYLARDPYVLGLKRGFDSRKIINELVIDKNGNIAYAKHSSMEIYDLFQTRYMMHKQIYNHRATKLIEMMIRDAILLVEPTIKMFESINDMKAFCSFTDNTIFEMIQMVNNPPPFFSLNVPEDQKEAFKAAEKILDNITHRILYRCVAQVSHLEVLKEFVEANPNDCLEILSVKIGFVSGNKADPFESIYFHNKHSNDNLAASSFIMNKKQISSMICDNHTESFHLLVCKDHTKYYDIIQSYSKWIADICIFGSSDNKIFQSFL